MRVYIAYGITDLPWGGINSFFSAFKHRSSGRNDIEVVPAVEDADVVLFGAASGGVNKNITFDFLESARRDYGCIIAHRLDGLRSMYSGCDDPREIGLVAALNSFADITIFQSVYCRDALINSGLTPKKHTVIYNGVNQNIFNASQKVLWDGMSPLKVLAVSWSNNMNKGFKIIAEASELYGIEMTFVGNWNAGVNRRKTFVSPPVPQQELTRYYRSSHVFLHAAENDPCPNAVLEALSCGLPVIYVNSGGTPELLKGIYGVSIQDGVRYAMEKVMCDYTEIAANIRRDSYYFSIDRSITQYVSAFNSALMR